MYSFAARGIDLLVSAAGLLILLPVLILIGTAVLLTLGRPVLFRQVRAGRHGRTFEVLKFRTMRPSTTDEWDPREDDARLTRLGRFLRATSLDELPTLWNVFRGQMALVGPRPLPVQYLPRYSPEQARRHEVRPGITGWTQVRGRNALSWEEKFDLDVWYVDNRSLLLDARILARTASAVLLRRGIAQEGHATMPEFTGSGSRSDPMTT